MPDATISEYEGGFTTADDAVHFTVRSYPDETDVDLHVTLSSRSCGSASIYHRLPPDEARELALALEKGADAAEATARVAEVAA